MICGQLEKKKILLFIYYNLLSILNHKNMKITLLRVILMFFFLSYPIFFYKIFQYGNLT